MIARAGVARLSWASPWPVAGLGAVLGLAIGALTGQGQWLGGLALLVGLALVLVIAREPRYGLEVLVPLVFLLPFAVVPARLGAQLTALEALLGMTAGVTLLRTLAHREQPRPGPRVLLLLAVIGIAGLSFVLSLPHAGGLVDVGRRFFKLVLAMLVFPLTLRLIRQAGQVERLTRLVILAGAAEAAVAIALQWAPRETTIRLLSSLGPLGYPTGPEIIRFLPGENDTYTDIARATGTSIDPNVLGGVLMLAAAVQLSQVFAPRPLFPRWLLAPLSAATVLAMLLSHSRSSWIGLAAGLLAVATLRYRRLWLGLGPAALAVGLLPVGRALFGRVLSGFGGQDKAASMRLDEYRNALEIVRQHPLIGIGFGGPPSIDLAPGVSSLYLTVAETMGLPALLLYLALLATLLWPALLGLLRSDRPEQQSLLAGLFAAVVAALAAGLFDHYFASTVFPHMVALFWLICALLWRVAKQGRPG